MDALDGLARDLAAALGDGVLCAATVARAEADEFSTAEEASVARAIPKRIAEFRAARQLARRLLSRLDFAPAPIPSDSARRPVWPAGAVGSIAHAGGACVVLVARSSDTRTLGIDVEPDRPLEPALWRRIATEAELGHGDRGRRALRLFSAKECVHKAQHPLVARALEFHDVEVELSDGAFRARAVRGAELPTHPVWTGVQMSRDGWILSGLRIATAR